MTEEARDEATLRAGTTLLRSRATPPAEPGPGCLDDYAVAGFVDGGLTGSDRERHLLHLAGCAWCRTAVSSVALARGSEEVAGALHSIEGRSGRPWRSAVAPLMGVAAAAILVFVTIRMPAPVEPAPHRDPPAAAGPAPVAISPSGPTTAVQALRWHSVAGADRYRVTVVDGDGNVLFEELVSDTVVALPEAVRLDPGRSYFWTVAARTAFDRWTSFGFEEFILVEGAR